MNSNRIIVCAIVLLLGIPLLWVFLDLEGILWYKPVHTPLMLHFEPHEKHIHRAVLSPNEKYFYITASNLDYTGFDILKIGGTALQPDPPIPSEFNSEWDDHGGMFSPDGNTFWFSSTRPTGVDNVLEETWHLWRSVYSAGKWSEPTYIDIPNLRDRLTSHPSVDKQGNLYFHSSLPDYTEMKLFVSRLKNGSYESANPLNLNLQSITYTPYITPKGEALYFACRDSGLVQCHLSTGKLPEGPFSVNRLPGLGRLLNQSNPSSSPDGRFLFYSNTVNQVYKVFCIDRQAFEE